jgi:hypothetical protein
LNEFPKVALDDAQDAAVPHGNQVAVVNAAPHGCHRAAEAFAYFGQCMRY